MSIIIPLLWILSSTLTLVLITKKRFETVLPLTFILGVFCFYFGGLLGKVSYGLIFCSLFCALSIPLLIKNKKEMKFYAEQFFTTGLVVFLGFYVFFSIYHFFTWFTTWDEFQHWGPMIKETMRLDAFYSVFESTLQTHKDYPPFITLLQALWCNLCGGYAEAYCYRALSIFSVSLFMPAFAKLDLRAKKDWLIALFHSLAIILVNLVSFVLLETMFTTIYIDYILGLFSAYVLYLVIQNQGKYSTFYVVNIGLSLAFLMMIKQMSIAFYAMALFMHAGLVILNKEKMNIKRIIWILVFMIAVPFLVSKSWELYNVKFELGWQFKISELSISGFLNLIFNGQGEAWQLSALSNFCDAIFNRTLITSPFPITYWWINALIAVLLFLVIYVFTKKIWDSSFILVTYCIGVLGYAVTMLMLYTYSFGPLEGPILASFERYINTYVYLGFCLVLMCFFWYGCSSLKKTYIMEVILLVILFSLSGTDSLKKLKIAEAYGGYLVDPKYNGMFSQIETALEEGDKVLLVTQYGDFTLQILKYHYHQYVINSVTLGEKKYEGDFFSVDYSLEEWKKLYSEYDYLYIYNTDEEFYHEYWLPVTDKELYEMNLYRIDKGGFCLVAPDGQCYD